MKIASARLRSQRLSAPAASVQETVRALGAVQGQDYAASLWAVGLRTAGATSHTVEAAIADGSIVRTWPMRGTLHLVSATDVRWILELLGPGMAASQCRRLRELGIDDALVARSQRAMTDALGRGRSMTRPQLYDALREGGISTADQAYHLIWRAAVDLVICGGPREGKQPTFALFDDLVPASPALPREEALARLAGRYFAGHGPATVHDLAWWSGLKVGDARLATAAAEGLVSRQADGVEYWLFPDVLDATDRSRRTFLLPAFDEYLVGYRDRSSVLAPRFKKTVNAGGGLIAPVVVRGGRVVGMWKRTTRGKVGPVATAKAGIRLSVTPFESPSRAWKEDVEIAIRRYLRFLSVEGEIEYLPEP